MAIVAPLASAVRTVVTTIGAIVCVAYLAAACGLGDFELAIDIGSVRLFWTNGRPTTMPASCTTDTECGCVEDCLGEQRQQLLQRT